MRLEKISTPVKVESKVWFANERTFISYLSMGLLLSTIASGLLFGAKDSMARRFAFGYAFMFAFHRPSISLFLMVAVPLPYSCMAGSSSNEDSL